MRNSIYHPVWQYKTRNSEERMKITNKQRKRKEQVAASLTSAENYKTAVAEGYLAEYGGVIQPQLPKEEPGEIRFEEIVKSVSLDFSLFKLRRHYQTNAAIWPTT